MYWAIYARRNLGDILMLIGGERWRHKSKALAHSGGVIVGALMPFADGIAARQADVLEIIHLVGANVSRRYFPRLRRFITGRN